MHLRKVFVFKDLNYAASKSSTTVNTALNPADLRDGAIGVYGIHEAGATNYKKLVLITDGGAESAGVVPMASFVGKQVMVAMGTSNGVQISSSIDKPLGLKEAVAEKYAAPVMGAYRIGYNGTAGSSLNLPATILKGEDLSITLIDRNNVVSGNRDPYFRKTFSIAANTPNESAYSLLKRWIAAASARTDLPLGFDKTKIKILNNGTGAVFTNTATVAGVNGATTLTSSAAHGITAGDLISLEGDLYVTIAGTTASTIVLDRPYQGPTHTIASADTLDITGAPTSWGLELVDETVGRNVTYAVDGLVYQATLKSQTTAYAGSGTQAIIAAMETEALPKKGTTDMITAYIKKDPIRASGTYDTYILTIQNAEHPRGAQGSVFKVLNYLTLAFVSGVADTSGFAQSDFEDIMTSLFTTFPAVSA